MRVTNVIWDLRSKSKGKPVYELLGGLQHKRLPSYASGGLSNWIAGAALDTHYYYPMPRDYPLWRLPN